LSDNRCRVIINANQKGGVGKTTNTTMEAIILAHVFNKKVLLIDEDMQGNETSFMSKTYDVIEFPMSLMKAIEEGDLTKAIVNLDENIDIIPGSYDMRKMVNFLIGKFKTEEAQTFYLSSLIDKIRDDYDFIFIDVPPSTDLKVDNAVVAADYLVVVQETQQFALEGSNTFISTYLNTLVDDFGSRFKTEIIGILPVLLQKKRKLHEKILETTKEKFGKENIFGTTIN
ncbi:AAA family ATPase, partial [Listeria monocytogenes]|nr:AAA family ATPase [Listeria monocytogenes]